VPLVGRPSAEATTTITHSPPHPSTHRATPPPPHHHTTPCLTPLDETTRQCRATSNTRVVYTHAHLHVDRTHHRVTHSISSLHVSTPPYHVSTHHIPLSSILLPPSRRGDHESAIFRPIRAEMAENEAKNVYVNEEVSGGDHRPRVRIPIRPGCEDVVSGPMNQLSASVGGGGEYRRRI